MRVAIVGPGRVGRSLAQLWPRSGVDAVLVPRHGVAPADADVVVLAVPDRAIAEAAAALPLGPLVVHVSGATALDALAPHVRRASLHPLMTFPGPDVGLPDLHGAPAAIAVADPADDATVDALVRALGMTPVRVPGDRRLYHAAAVMAGNFATVLLAEAGDVLAAAGVPAEQARALLAPLALASVRHAIADPAAALTGPVARGDADVLAAHRAALAEHGLQGAAALYDSLIGRAEALLARSDRSPRSDQDRSSG